MGNVPSQMINYFNTKTALESFQFQFDPDRWVPSPQDLNDALKANKNLFNTNNKEVWEKYLSMVEGNIKDIPLDDVEALINKITSPSVFSKIVNP